VVALVPHMLDKLGLSGLFGVLLILAGIGVVAWNAPIVAAGLVLVLLGLALVVRRAAKSVMGMFGF
jgi:hypothetical protein